MNNEKNFVSTKEYMREMTTAFMEIKHMKSAIERIDTNVQDMHKKLFEGNGEKPYVTMIKEHENKINILHKRVDNIESKPIKRKAEYFDMVSKIIVRGVTILAMVGLGFLIVDDPSKIHKIIQLILH